jgi:hypothetical protein
MVQPNLQSFEEQLQRSADELNFKPSNKVWQGVENSLNNNSTLGAGASITKSLFSNWILNLLVPAVVLVGGGSIFYSNYSTVESASTKEVNATDSKTNVTNPETVVNSTTVAEITNEPSVSKKEVVVAAVPSKNISENQNNANAVNYSLGYTNNSQMSQNSSLTNLLNLLTKKQNSTSEETISNSNIVFTNSDIEKISKKELEKNTKSEYQERNVKSVDFSE